MNKIFALITVLLLSCVAQAASSVSNNGFVYWTVDPVSQESQFAYVMFGSRATESSETVYLTIGNTSETVAFNQNTFPNSTDLGGAFYSPVVDDGSEVSYFVELYNVQGEKVGTSGVVTYAELVNGGFVYEDMSVTGVQSPYRFSVSGSPEPTSGLLLLLGMGVLALRRKRFAGACLLAAAVTGASFGAVNDTVLSFSTPGIDRYADGSRVREGESYALVWTAQGATFGGLTADCLPVAETDRLVLVAPLAKRGRCPVTVVEIAAAEAKQYDNGTFALYLLDTRTRGADGTVVLASYVNGLPKVVNSVGATDAQGKDLTSVEGVAAGINATAAVKMGEVGVYSQIAAPQITAIAITGAQIRLQVEGMSDAAEYFVVPGSGPGRFLQALSAQADANGFTFEKPEGQDATFYKVIGVRRFGAAAD